VSEGDEVSESGDESSDGAGVAPEYDPCDDVADCMGGEPFALVPCAAELDVSPTQCGFAQTCTRQIAWLQDGLAIPAPDEIAIEYAHRGQPAFTQVGVACFAPADGYSCFVPCDFAPAPPTPLETMRVTYVCADGLTRTWQQPVVRLDGPIQLHC
jgi:hypothetical protein